jgi:hypothetical protein
MAREPVAMATKTWLPPGPNGLGTSAARLGHVMPTKASDRSAVDQDSPNLQDVDFGCPWPLRVSPFLDQARNHALAWMERFGLTKDPEANEKTYRHWKLGEAVATFFPDATPGGLDLAADLWGWYFAPFDDSFDGELGRDPRRAAVICQDLCAILAVPDGGALPASYPVAAAFADIWWRSCRNMSPAWKQRGAQHWKQYFMAHLGEVLDRCHHRAPDLISCLRQRCVSSSTGPSIDLIEVASGYEVPEVAWLTPLLSELRQLAGEIIAITNDLVSADKEAAEGDRYNNVLLVLEDQGHCSRTEAIDVLRQMTHERFRRFLRLERHVLDLDDVVGPAGSVALRRHVLGLHDIVAGDNEWEHTSGRYEATD